MKSHILLSEYTRLTLPVNQEMEPLHKLGLVQVTDSGDGEQRTEAANVYEPPPETFKSLLFKFSQLLLARCVITSFTANHLPLSSAFQLTI